jgi:hypothetical protein
LGSGLRRVRGCPVRVNPKECIMANTQMKDKDYDLISVVYHAAQGADTVKQYSDDARKAGDQDAAAYFDEVGQHYGQRVKKGKDLLKRRL